MTTKSNTSIPRAEALTLDEKIGQLFIYAGHGVFMNEQSPTYRDLLTMVRDEHVGGMLWFLSNVHETALINDQLQRAAKIPLLVSADLESGVGMRFEQTTFWPWPMAIAATGDPALAEAAGRIVAREALEIGVNHIFAPVADVNNDPDNPVINARSFGEDPQTVAKFVAAYVRGIQSEGVLATAKHFPGHGDTHTDSHRSLPVLSVDRMRMDAVELVPFRAALDAGVGSVMVGHLAIPSLDDTAAPPREDRPRTNWYGAAGEEAAENASLPASLSKKIVDGLLREEMKFDGLVVTDALDMGGITDHFSPGEAAVRAIEAGCDQIAKSDDTRAAIAGVKEAVRSGRLSEARIDQSVRRILEAKKKVKDLDFDPRRIMKTIDAPEHLRLAREIAERAVTLVREEPSLLPLHERQRVVEIVFGDFVEAVPPLLDLDTALRARLEMEPARFVLDRRSNDAEVAAIVDAARLADVVVLAFAIRARSGEGAIALPPVGRKVLDAVLALPAKKVAISFGTPYILREMPAVETYIAAYGVQPVMQEAAVRALFGEVPFRGKLPVSIPGLHRIGDGITR
jgi:beta-N-acetylhexosaminidase